jgi:hypothetical protein
MTLDLPIDDPGPRIARFPRVRVGIMELVNPADGTRPGSCSSDLARVLFIRQHMDHATPFPHP